MISGFGLSSVVLAPLVELWVDAVPLHHVRPAWNRPVIKTSLPADDRGAGGERHAGCWTSWSSIPHTSLACPWAARSRKSWRSAGRIAFAV